ncbi:MAG: hypothetical protein ABJ246_03590, partial [Paracoccaceae bacterium]
MHVIQFDTRPAEGFQIYLSRIKSHHYLNARRTAGFHGVYPAKFWPFVRVCRRKTVREITHPT